MSVESLGLIAGKGTYPLELARGARAQGISRICAVAFRGETAAEIAEVADEVVWIRVGELARFLEAFRVFGVSHAVMAGQIAPSNLFHARLDKPMRELLGRLPRRNADTIFGAIGDELNALGVELLPASAFMEDARVEAGLLTGKLEDQDEQDIRQGLELAKACARLQAGQSVAVKQGTVIAVEGFEGTDQMILRAGKIGGEGCVVVKIAQQRHDMRWDIPVVGTRTIRNLRKAKCRGLALEAGKAILLEREEVLRQAAEAGLFLVVLESA
jgi:DUF1009 family protein